MTAKEAYFASIKYGSFECGEQLFAMVGFKSEDGHVEGPLFITIEHDVAIEIDRKGKFKNAYTAKMDRFFSWVTML